MEELKKIKNDELLRMASTLGVNVPFKGKQPTKTEIIEALLEKEEDINTWLEAKSNVKKDLKKMGNIQVDVPKGKRYVGKHPITQEPVYK